VISEKVIWTHDISWEGKYEPVSPLVLIPWNPTQCLELGTCVTLPQEKRLFQTFLRNLTWLYLFNPLKLRNSASNPELAWLFPKRSVSPKHSGGTWHDYTYIFLRQIKIAFINCKFLTPLIWMSMNHRTTNSFFKSNTIFFSWCLSEDISSIICQIHIWT
jgi:hypothetical protein